MCSRNSGDQHFIIVNRWAVKRYCTLGLSRATWPRYRRALLPLPLKSQDTLSRSQRKRAHRKARKGVQGNGPLPASTPCAGLLLQSVGPAPGVWNDLDDYSNNFLCNSLGVVDLNGCGPPSGDTPSPSSAWNRSGPLTGDTQRPSPLLNRCGPLSGDTAGLNEMHVFDKTSLNGGQSPSSMPPVWQAAPSPLSKVRASRD